MSLMKEYIEKQLSIPDLQNKNEQYDQKALISFIERTKNGEYAIIDKKFIVPRFEEQADSYADEEEYFYSVR